MDANKMLEKYADVIVNIGINIKANEKLAIRLTEEALPLAQLVVKKAYQKGALNVRLDFMDDQMTLDRYLHGSDGAFDCLPGYEVTYRDAIYKDGYNVLNLETPNPELLKSVDPKRIARWQKLAGMKWKPIIHYTMQNEVKWCVAGVAGKAWAQASSPSCPLKRPMANLGFTSSRPNGLTNQTRLRPGSSTMLA